MIEVRALTKRFNGTTAVDAVSFTVQEGETLALIGTSGSGKTTTLRMINRLIEPSSGQIWVNGEAVLDRPAELLRRDMGYVIQHTGLFPHFDVEANIGVVPRLLGWEADRIRSRAIQLLEQLGLPPGDFLDKYPRQLSGGQQQRVGIARALAADPPIVLMDEPFGALDPITRTEIRSDFQELEELRRKTVIMVTHDVEEAFAMADWVCLLDAGQVQQIGSPRDLLFQPANAFVVEFLRGQQLVLQMQTVTLADLAPWLPDDSEAADGSAHDLPPEHSVREAMQHLQSEPGPVRFTRDGKCYPLELSSLSQAFYAFLDAP